MAVSISLADDIDISRGDMIARPNNQPHVTQDFDATVCWMADDAALEPGRDYVIKHTTRTTRARVTALDYRLDVNTLHRDKSATALKINELGRVTLRTQVPLLLDEYSPQRGHRIVHPDRPRHQRHRRRGHGPRHHAGGDASASPNAVRHQNPVSPPRTGCRKGSTVWFTGLSGSGKSSVAMLVEQKLLEKGVPLTFSTVTTCATGSTPTSASRWPTAPRTCAGWRTSPRCSPTPARSCWCPPISPLEEHRALARKVHTDAGLRLLRGVLRHPAGGLRAPRPQGAVRQGAAGEITHFTGIDSPYQRPKNPDLRLTPDRDARRAGADMVDRACCESRRMMSDHELAARLATEAGELLLGVRAELADATAAERKAAGDKRSHDFLMAALAAERPGDAVLSEEGADEHRLAADRGAGVDRRPARRHPGVLRTRPRGLGRARGAVAGRRTGRRRGRASRAGRHAGDARRWPPPPAAPAAPRIVVSRTRPPAVALAVRDALDGTLVEMGSAGAKVASVVQGVADVYVHAGGQYEWDSAAPVAVARAAGLFTSRIDGSPLRYNQADVLLPDLIVCRPELADAVLAVTDRATERRATDGFARSP